MTKKDNQLRKPIALAPGDTIGVAAPAGPFDREKFQNGIEVLNEMGFKTKIPRGLYKKERYLAGDDAHRARILNQLFSDDSIDGIICARGGFGSIRILDRLDLAAIRLNPKVFIGFSDITVLLTILCQKCGMLAFHGPMVTTLATADGLSRKSFYRAITSGEKLKFTLRNGRTLHPGSATGPVIGGNMATLCHLAGTPYVPDLAGCILLLEDVGEAPYKVDRMLMQMQLAGYFHNLAGLGLGSFSAGGRIDQVYSVFRRILQNVDFPILAGLEIGHGRRNLALPLGLTATLDADRHFLEYHDAAVLNASI